MSLKYHLVTLGCPKNVVDSEGMAGLLERAGYSASQNEVEAEVLIVNTCGFIGPAREESLAALRGLAATKRPDQLLIATGCLVQRADGELPKLVPGLDAVLSTRRWHEIVSLVAGLRQDAAYGDIPEAGFVAAAQPWLEGRPVPSSPAAPILPGTDAGFIPPQALDAQLSALQRAALRRRPRTASAYLKIGDGCSASCAFCTIPGIKGAWRSKTPEQIVAEARDLVAQGVLEVILIAQDTTAYGYDRGERDALAGLIDRVVDEVPGLAWLRIMYAFPGRVTPRLVETMARHPQVVKYLDMPLQHGHPATLARMRRPGPGVAQRNVEALRAAMPGIAIRTGFIVGYPGETEQEFQGLVDFVRDMRFDRVGVFTYCREPGTPAHDLPDQVPDEVKDERRARIMELQQRISLKKNRKLVGKDLEVLVEGAGDGISVARSYRDAPEVDGMVLVQGERPADRLLRVRVTGAMEYDLMARAQD